jgi:RyR domain
MNEESIAKVCHEANRAYCQTIGDNSQLPWEQAEEWQQNSAITGVEYAIGNPYAPASAQHDAWLADKPADGWKYGPEKKPDIREHPCWVPYDQLPIEQKKKDALFKAVVAALK